VGLTREVGAYNHRLQSTRRNQTAPSQCYGRLGVFTLSEADPPTPPPSRRAGERGGAAARGDAGTSEEQCGGVARARQRGVQAGRLHRGGAPVLERPAPSAVRRSVRQPSTGTPACWVCASGMRSSHWRAAPRPSLDPTHGTWAKRRVGELHVSRGRFATPSDFPLQDRSRTDADTCDAKV
jgi:hypothetical protein